MSEVDSAMGKLFRMKPEPLSIPRHPTLIERTKESVRTVEAQLAIDTTPQELRASLEKLQADGLASLEAMETDRYEGEIHPMTFADRMTLDVWMCAREDDEAHSALSDETRANRMMWWRKRKFAQIVFRKKGTDGKVHVLTDLDLFRLDSEVANKIMEVHAKCFELTESQFPKAEAAP